MLYNLCMVYLSIILGSEHCRIVKGHLNNDGMVAMETVHTFENEPFRNTEGALVWDTERIYSEVVLGLQKSGKTDIVSVSGWGSDFVLTDESGEVLYPSISYRDWRLKEVEPPADDESLFMKMGFHPSERSMIYQLLLLKKEHPEVLEKAAYLLSVPDYITYRLTGVIKHEYTASSLSGLVDLRTHSWNHETIDSLGLPVHLFTELSDPGTAAGPVRSDVEGRIGCKPFVVLAPSAPESAAVVGSPVEDDGLYIISGDSIAAGCISSLPLITEEAFRLGFGNSGHINGTFLVGKQIGCPGLLKALAKPDCDLNSVKLRGNFKLPDNSDDIAADAKEAMGEDISGDELYLSLLVSIASEIKECVSGLEKLTERKFTSLSWTGPADEYLIKLLALSLNIPVILADEDAVAMGMTVSDTRYSGERVKRYGFVKRFRRL